MHRWWRVTTGVAGVLGALIAGLPAAGSAAAAAAAPTVAVRNPGTLGRFDTAIVTVKEQCSADTKAGDLEVRVSQAAVVGSQVAATGIVCDGVTHRVRVEVSSDSGEPFVPGAADVFVRFTVYDASSGDPRPQAQVSSTITLLAPAETWIGEEGQLVRFGAASVPVIYRCQRPWVVSELDVELTQDTPAGAVGGATYLDTGLRCDARRHHLAVGVTSDTGEPFVRGFADVTLRLTVQDPASGDPVWQASASSRLWISPAARIVVESARLRDGRVGVGVAVRCHRPWDVSQWVVEVTQRDDRVGGEAIRRSGFTCDDLWHHLTVAVTGSTRFRHGSTVVSALLDISDPASGDPVTQATDRRVFQL